MTDALKAELTQRAEAANLLIVVGTGVALTVTDNAPLASWKDLIANGVKRCVDLDLCDAKWADHQKQLLEGNIQNLLGVAEQVSNLLGWKPSEPCGGNWNEWLRHTVGALHVQQPQLIEAVRNIGAPIATLNYDSLLTQVTGRRPVTWQQAERWLPVLTGEDEAILHLHGHWDRPSSVVLGIRSYDAVLDASFAQHLQRALASLWRLVFIGCSGTLVDPNFTALLDWMANHLHGAEHRHYLLLRRGEDLPVGPEVLRKARVHRLDYGDNYTDLPSFIQSLAPKSLVQTRTSSALAGETNASSMEPVGRTAHPHDIRLARRIRGAFDEDTKSFLRDHHFGVTFRENDLKNVQRIADEWRGVNHEFVDKDLGNKLFEVVLLCRTLAEKIAEYASETRSGRRLAVQTDQELAVDSFSQETRARVRELNDLATKTLEAYEMLEEEIRLKLPELYVE